MDGDACSKRARACDTMSVVDGRGDGIKHFGCVCVCRFLQKVVLAIGYLLQSQLGFAVLASTCQPHTHAHTNLFTSVKSTFLKISSVAWLRCQHSLTLSHSGYFHQHTCWNKNSVSVSVSVSVCHCCLNCVLPACVTNNEVLPVGDTSEMTKWYVQTFLHTVMVIVRQFQVFQLTQLETNLQRFAQRNSSARILCTSTDLTISRGASPALFLMLKSN